VSLTLPEVTLGINQQLSQPSRTILIFRDEFSRMQKSCDVGHMININDPLSFRESAGTMIAE
jgi:hypothetical protein